MPSVVRIALDVVTGLPLGVFSLGLCLSAAALPLGLVVALRKRQRPGSAPQPERFVQFTREMAPVPLAMKLSGALMTVQALAAWPVASPRPARQRFAGLGSMESAADMQLRPLDRGIAVFSAALMTGLALLAVADVVWRPFLLVLPVVVLAGIAARHLAYLTGKLSERLRHSLSAPLPAALAIATADLVAITVASSLILAPHAGAHLGLAGLRTGALDLLAFKKLTWSTIPGDSDRQLLVACAGLLFYLALAKTLLNPGQYSRGGADYSAVAVALVTLGRVREAQEWALRDKDLSRESMYARAHVAFARGDFKEALAKVAAARRSSGEDDGIDHCVMWLFAPAFAGHFRSDDAKLTSFFGDALDAGAGDPALACCLLNAASWGIAVNARPLTSLLPRLPEDGYPLSRAIVTGLAGDLPAAVELLLRARPGSEIEEVVRLCLIAQARAGITAAGGDGAWLPEWEAEALPRLRELSRSMPGQWRKMTTTALIGTSIVVERARPGSGGELGTLGREVAATVMTPPELSSWISGFQATMPEAGDAAEVMVIPGRAGVTGALPAELPGPDPRARQAAILLPAVTVRKAAVSSLGYLAAVADDQSRVHVVKFAIDDDDEAQVLQVITPAERPRGDDDVLVSVADDEDRIATAAGRTCEVWNGRSGERLASLRHEAEIRAMALSEDGAMVATSDVKGRLARWDVSSGRRQDLEAVRARITGLAIGLGGLLIAGVSASSGVAWIWDGRTGKLMQVLQHVERNLPREIGWAVAFSSLGEYALTAFSDGMACAWSMLEDNLAVRLRHQRAGEGALGSIVKAVAMSEDQNAIVTGHTSGAWLWDATTGALRGCLSRGFIGSVGFTHAGDIVLAARGTRGVRVIRWTEPATDATTAEETR